MSASNPLHRSINAGNTRRNEKKLERSWEELQSEKKAFLKRKEEDDLHKKMLKDWLPLIGDEGGHYDDSAK